MTHDFSLCFDTENEYWQRVLDIFAKNEKYEKKVVSNRNLHHKFPRSFSKILGEEIDNDKDNLISLSLADHFLVHYYYYLLAKKGFRQSMATAFTFMAKKGLKYLSPETAEEMAKDYEEAVVISSRAASERFKDHVVSKETRNKISKTKKENMSDKTKLKIANAKSEYWKTHTISDEQQKRMAKTRTGKKRGHYKKNYTTWYKGPDGKRIYK